MLQNIFFHEIAMFSDFFTFSNITIAVFGLFAGIFLSLVRVRSQKEKKDFSVAVLSVWVLFHLCAWFYAKVGTRADKGWYYAYSIISVMAPFSTFLLLGAAIGLLIKR